MGLTSRTWLLILRQSIYLLFLAIVGWWFWDNYSAGHVNWFMLILGLSLLTQAIAGISEIDLVVGILLSLLSCYMLLAVTSDLIDHFNGSKPVRHVFLYFGGGYGIFGTAFFASLLLIFVYQKRK